MEALDCSDSWENNSVEIIDRISNELGCTLPAPSKSLKMVVIIPAKNESQTIEKTLRSLNHQIDGDKAPFPKKSFEILVLAHNCSDDTFAKCDMYFKKNPLVHGHVLLLNSDIANTVGSARRVLMNIAFYRLSFVNGLIISTDADTVPDKKWLHNLEGYLEKEVSLICGLIVSNGRNLNQQALKYLRAKDEYLMLRSRLESTLLPNTHDPWPKHSYNWGPNLAIKKYVYGAIGGIKPLHFLEDVDMYNRVVGRGYIARHCMNSKVVTSTRIDSRCHEGFGAELRDWTEIDGVAYNVEGLEKLLARYEILGLIKNHFPISEEKHLLKISKLASLSMLDLKEMINQCQRVEALTIAMEEYLNKSTVWNSDFKNKGVLEVCKELNNYFKISDISNSNHFFSQSISS